MTINSNENRPKVHTTPPTSDGRFIWRMWHQEVTIGNDDNKQIVHLKGKRREEIEALKTRLNKQ